MATPALVVSNNSQSGALRRAKLHAIPNCHLSSKHHKDSDDLDRSICRVLVNHSVELIVLAGYMKKLGPVTLQRFEGRILNTHPSLLPQFGGRGMYGNRVHAAVLASGAKYTGISIHLVVSEYDKGSVVAQRQIAVQPRDTAETLGKRVQAQERSFLIETLQAIIDQEILLPIR